MNNQQKAERAKEYVRILKVLIEELSSLQSFMSEVRTKKDYQSIDNLIEIYDRFFNNELINKHIFYERKFVAKSTHSLFVQKELNRENAYYHLKLKIKSDELNFLDNLYDNIASVLLNFFKQLFSYIHNLNALNNVDKIRKYELFINKVKFRITDFVEKCEKQGRPIFPNINTVGLPKYLNNLIFNELEGVYSPRSFNVSSNIKNTSTENKTYLGTYFPRSFVEAFSIFSELFNNSVIKNTFSKKTIIRIADFGTGTGGNLIGFLHLLSLHGLADIPIEIHTFEGNQDAIKYQNDIINQFNKEFIKEIVLVTHHINFKSKADLKTQMNSFRNEIGDFDIIMSFKFLNEFYRSSFSENQGIYFTFSEIATQLIKKDGLIIIADVLDKVSNGMFLTQMMANEINKLVEEFDYSYILPLSCAFFCKNCKERNCYTGLTFITQHDKKNDDQSKLTFRVLAHSEFTNKVLAKIEKKEFYEVNYNSWAKPICENGKLVSYKKSSSAFKITNDNHVE